MMKHLAIFLLWLLCYSFANAQVLITDAQIDIVSKNHDKYAKRRLVSWKKLVARYQSASDAKKLTKVNNFFNLMQYQSDLNYIGKRDHWMTPIEFLLEGAGDCEDYSIAKYFTLIALGLPTEKLRITYVKAIQLNQAHMVLAYYPTPGADPLVLDNLTSKILKASLRKDLVPVYSFNGSDLWLAKSKNQDHHVGSSERIKVWRGLLERMQQEKKDQ